MVSVIIRYFHISDLKNEITLILDGDIIIEEGEPDLEPILEESLQLESEFPIFELTDDLSGLQNLIPAYKSERPVCKQSLKEFSGFRCVICHRSFENEELAQVKNAIVYYYKKYCFFFS